MSTPIKMKYTQINSQMFQQALQKLAATPTNNANACRIRKVTRAISDAREQIKKEYLSDIRDQFAARDEKGDIIEADQWAPVEGKEEELLAAQNAFGEREAELDCWPVTHETLVDVRMSAQEIEAFKSLFDENAKAPQGAGHGPGLPSNVASLR